MIIPLPLGRAAVGRVALIVMLSALGLASLSAQTLYIANGATNSVGTYNATTGQAISTGFISGFNSIARLELSGSNLYVADSGAGTVHLYNANTGTAVGSFTTITGLNNPYDVAVSGSDLFVVQSGSSIIGRYNATTGAPITPSFIAGLNHPSWIMASGSTLYVADSSSVASYDLNTGLASGSFTTITGMSPAGMAMYNGDLYVADYAGGIGSAGNVRRFNATTGASLNASFVTGLWGPSGLAFAGSYLFVDSFSGSSVGRYDASTGTVVNSSYFSIGNPRDIVVSAVPEPSTSAIIGGACALGITLITRRTRRRAATAA